MDMANPSVGAHHTDNHRHSDSGHSNFVRHLMISGLGIYPLFNDLTDMM
jgi:hypothetical protein